MRALNRRVAALEAERKAKALPIPRRVYVRVFDGEPYADAIASFVARHGKPNRGHGLIVLPAKPRTAEERARWEQRFFEQQNTLIDRAKTERLASRQPEQASALLLRTDRGAAVSPRFRISTDLHRN